ncbi:hypothetical protein GOL32_28285 [Sinorhizobium medicae]|nr:hypothetical protein [Sinorhizobium medicae]
MTTSRCVKCGKIDFVAPLHGDRGGPAFCLLCAGVWHAEHGRVRKYGRIVVKAIRAYLNAGGRSRDIEGLQLAATGFSVSGFEADTIGAACEDLSLELLNETLRLTHPDMHPPERKEKATEVTQKLLALKPFVFPEPKPEPAQPMKPNDASSNFRHREMGKPSSPPYPCPDCKNTIPRYYCDACKAEYEKQEQQKRDEREKERQQRNARQRERYAEKRQWTRKKAANCIACGLEFQPRRRDAKYCSAACRQRAYVKRDGNGSNERPLESASIERAIEATFAAEPDNALTTAELCARVFPDVRHVKWRYPRSGKTFEKAVPDKKHRVAVIAAARRVIERQLTADPDAAWDFLRGESRGSGLVFFGPGVFAYALARLKGDWLHADDPEEELRARLAPGGKDHHLIADGGHWRRHWEIYLAERKGETDTPRYKALRKEQDRVNAGWGL